MNRYDQYSSSKQNTPKTGFTIVELLVVIVIIGILAAITIVAYRGIVERAIAAAVQSDVANAGQKVQLEQVLNIQYPPSLSSISDLRTDGETKYKYTYDNTSVPKKFCLSGYRNNIIYSISEDRPTTKGACMTNMLIDSDFTMGDEEWEPVYSTLTTNNNTLTNVANGTMNYAQARQYIPTNVGHKYYIRAKLRVLNSSSQKIFCLVDTNGNQTAFQTLNPTANTWYESSGIVTINDSTYTLLKFTHLYADEATANNKSMEIQYAMAIDLTDAFGVGNEPTKEKIDEALANVNNKWFENTNLVEMP